MAKKKSGKRAVGAGLKDSKSRAAKLIKVTTLTKDLAGKKPRRYPGPDKKWPLGGSASPKTRKVYVVKGVDGWFAKYGSARRAANKKLAGK